MNCVPVPTWLCFDVTRAVAALTSPATGATDKISLQLLKLSMPAVAAQIARIFNMSITTASFPSSWKVGQVVPVFKKGNRADYNNYHLRILLPLLSKTMEHVVHQQLKSYLELQAYPTPCAAWLRLNKFHSVKIKNDFFISSTLVKQCFTRISSLSFTCCYFNQWLTI